MDLSIIIPTLNEQKNIGSLLPFLRNLDDTLELIVVDGYSNDNTVVFAKPFANYLL